MYFIIDWSYSQFTHAELNYINHKNNPISRLHVCVIYSSPFKQMSTQQKKNERLSLMDNAFLENITNLLDYANATRRNWKCQTLQTNIAYLLQIKRTLFGVLQATIW
jgi:hypothetical protein